MPWAARLRDGARPVLVLCVSFVRPPPPSHTLALGCVCVRV